MLNSSWRQTCWGLFHIGRTVLELARKWAQLTTAADAVKSGSNQLMMLPAGRLVDQTSSLATSIKADSNCGSGSITEINILRIFFVRTSTSTQTYARNPPWASRPRPGSIFDQAASSDQTPPWSSPCWRRRWTSAWSRRSATTTRGTSASTWTGQRVEARLARWIQIRRTENAKTSSSQVRISA